MIHPPETFSPRLSISEEVTEFMIGCLGGKNQAIVFADADIDKGRSKLILVHTFKTNTGKSLTVKPLRIQAFL